MWIRGGTPATADGFHCERLSIPPRHTRDVKFDFLPRKVNADYKKQITVRNLKNPANELSVTLTASNNDEHRVLFHSLFYRFIPISLSAENSAQPLSLHTLSTLPQPTPSPASAAVNSIHFGSMVFYHSVARAFCLKNITPALLALRLTASQPDEIKLYTYVPASAARPVPTTSAPSSAPASTASNTPGSSTLSLGAAPLSLPAPATTTSILPRPDASASAPYPAPAISSSIPTTSSAISVVPASPTIPSAPSPLVKELTAAEEVELRSLMTPVPSPNLSSGSLLLT